MAGLLDYLKKGVAGFGDFGMKLGEANIAADPAVMEMLTPEQRAAAQKKANLAARAAMHEAAQSGAPWWEMLDRRDFKAQPAHENFITSAAASVEELRKRRDADGRRQKVSELVARLSNPDDPLAKEYSAEQIAVLGALGPDEQAAMLAKTAFPKESGINVATAGSLQYKTKLPNGNLGIVVQTGNPANPFEVKDAGVPYYETDPANVRSAYAFATDPRLAQGVNNEAQARSTGAETGKVNVAALTALPQALAATNSRIESLKGLQSQLANLPTNQLTGQTLVYYDTQFQIARAAVLEEALLNLGRLKDAGVNLQPITEKELAILMDTSARMTNNREANVAILQQRIDALMGIKNRIDEQLRILDAGGNITDWRPGQAPPPSPAATPGAGPYTPPAGGPGSVSTIPTIKRPGQ